MEANGACSLPVFTLSNIPSDSKIASVCYEPDGLIGLIVNSLQELDMFGESLYRIESYVMFLFPMKRHSFLGQISKNGRMICETRDVVELREIIDHTKEGFDVFRRSRYWESIDLLELVWCGFNPSGRDNMSKEFNTISEKNRLVGREDNSMCSKGFENQMEVMFMLIERI